jgi:osmotically-inducible protein OsmY
MGPAESEWQRERREQGRFAGRGPKGYRRSDERVLEDVNQALEDAADIDASEIEVTCQNGEVVLRGSVCDRRAKRMAEDVIEGMPGVKDVRLQDLLTFERPGPRR